MKSAKVTTVAIEVSCPHCQELDVSPYTGSQLWPIYDIDMLITESGQIFTCDNCGEDYRIPKRVPGRSI